MGLFFLCFSLCFADGKHTSIEQKNILLVKRMFSDYTEKKDITKFDTYHTKDFEFKKNDKTYSYQEYKDIERNVFNNLKVLKIVKYNAISANKNQVKADLTVKIINHEGIARTFNTSIIAKIENNKISRMTEEASLISV